MQLTRKLIEIRSLLMSIDQDETLVLPSIVVIGSQSSGKSSVLEAIVGHEFLPKGNNMVTRRPLELTLIHTPPTSQNPSPEEYSECAEFGPGKFSDFTEVQQRLTRLNQAVPDTIAVSETPIYLKVYSPHVPDLTLVDLPGYVQVSSMDQPEELREKIQQLCEKYLRKPNLILSVCAADVDLANSPALRASRRVDPHGYRTIGVVTKMDLVDPKIGVSILSNEKYRLQLGYVGVVCKSSKSGSSRREGIGGNSQMNQLAEHEHQFFRSHPDAYGEPNLMLGTVRLKQRLMNLLEESMSSSLHDISNRISLELEEATYQYKVQYNDRHISADTYVSETMDSLKRRLSEFSKCLAKGEVRGMLKSELNQKVLGLLAEIYWSDRRIGELGKVGESRVRNEGIESYWVHRLQAVQSRLTKGGIGRCASDLVADEIRFAITKIIEQEPISYHPSAKSEVLTITEDILDGLRSRAADHVEIAVMPYRYELEISKNEWENSRLESVKLMEEEMKMCEEFLKNEKVELRRNWRLREALEHVKEDEERLRRKAQRWILDGSTKNLESEVREVEVEETRPPPILLDRARRLRDMETRSEILRLRTAAIKSRRCKSGPNAQSFCPETFLNVLADRLSSTSTDFIKIDLLSRFFSAVPHEINSRLIKSLEGSRAIEFARENPEVKRHLELQDRKEKLEKVMRELVTLSYMKEENSNGLGINSLSGNRRQGNRSMGYFSNFF
ncbi:P-loop containing nucleoside triphosphate hydrolase protein [Melampsora americana]|nr:P-loop containing nucleoside triphosphate hydrolase protein [Melampsora americana]